MMRIIGIDPGSRATGWGIIELNGNNSKHIASGCIFTPSRRPTGEKLLFLYQKMDEILAEFSPTEAGIEDLFFAKNAKSALLLGHARGVILLSLTEHGIPFTAYPARTVKKALTGYGHAAKEQVQYMIKNLLCLKEEPEENASDALALAYCHMQHKNRLKK